MAEMTPAAWLDGLDKRLTARWNGNLATLDDYFNGKHPLEFITSNARREFGAMIEQMADNWCRIVVQASVQRLRVQGFRFGKGNDADELAWDVWQANGLDGQAKMVHTEAVKLGTAYWLVAPPAPGEEFARVTAEHPSQVIVAHAPGDRRLKLAALKRWVDDDDGYVYATLYLPDRIWKLRSQRKTNNGVITGKIEWRERPGDSGGRNVLGVVPVIPVERTPSMLGGGQSALIPGIPLQNAINALTRQTLVSADFAGHRQRVMTGIEDARYPPDYSVVELRGQRIPIELGATRLFTVEDPNAKVFDLPATELDNYIGAIEMFVAHMAAQTQTPPHYLLGKMINISGDALTAAEAGLNSRVEDEQETLDDGHEDMMRLAFRAMGDDTRASAMDAETIWAEAERRSFAQVIDGAGKMHDMGIPDEIVWEEMGWSPQKIRRAKTLQSAADLMRAADSATGTPAAAEVEAA